MMRGRRLRIYSRSEKRASGVGRQAAAPRMSCRTITALRHAQRRFLVTVAPRNDNIKRLAVTAFQFNSQGGCLLTEAEAMSGALTSDARSLTPEARRPL